ncbi:MAG: MliC family protein [Bacteroidia bacterium]|nr:MliC family protein [Bacteroidia bacterium]
MKQLFLAFTIVISLVVISCNQVKNKKVEKTGLQTETTEHNNSKQTVADKILTSEITNKEGDKLDVTFNNTNKTATLNFKGETIEMIQDTMGSGIKYSNKNYEFSEWHGKTELKKDGKIILKKY